MEDTEMGSVTEECPICGCGAVIENLWDEELGVSYKRFVCHNCGQEFMNGGMLQKLINKLNNRKD